jgi:hypothetical protein
VSTLPTAKLVLMLAVFVLSGLSFAAVLAQSGRNKEKKTKAAPVRTGSAGPIAEPGKTWCRFRLRWLT